MKILFASTNESKLREFKEIFNKEHKDIELVSMKDLNIDIDVIEDCDTLEGNAIKKAREIYEVSNMPVISEDFGFFIEKYKQIAGVHAKRWLEGTEKDRNLAIIDMMKDDKDEERNAYYESVLCYYDGEKSILGVGYTKGRVAESERGDNGFAYDKILELDSGMTIAELSSDEKNSLSSRKLALVDLIENMDIMEL